jgi:hypothetical protein
MHFAPRLLHDARSAVDHHVAYRHRLIVARRIGRAAAQVGARAREQLGDAEWLFDVVVGTGVERAPCPPGWALSLL